MEAVLFTIVSNEAETDRLMLYAIRCPMCNQWHIDINRITDDGDGNPSDVKWEAVTESAFQDAKRTGYASLPEALIRARGIASSIFDQALDPLDWQISIMPDEIWAAAGMRFVIQHISELVRDGLSNPDVEKYVQDLTGMPEWKPGQPLN